MDEESTLGSALGQVTSRLLGEADGLCRCTVLAAWRAGHASCPEPGLDDLMRIDFPLILAVHAAARDENGPLIGCGRSDRRPQQPGSI